MSSAVFKKPWPYVALLLAHVIWGANFIVAKVTLQEIPLYSLAFLRFALACLFLAPFFFIHNKKIKIDSKDLPKLIAIGILIITLNIGLFFAGIERTNASTASVLSLIIPSLSVLAGWIFLKEKVYIVNILGIIMGLGGALVIIGLPQILQGELDPKVVVGNVLIILSSITWVIGGIFSKEMLNKYPSMVVTGFAFLVGVITFAIPALREYLLDPTWPQRVSPLGLFGLLYMTMLSSISAYFLFEWGLAKTSLVSADLFQYIEPFIAAFLAVLILGETISFSFLIGAVLVTLGAYWGTFAKERHHRTQKAHRT